MTSQALDRRIDQFAELVGGITGDLRLLPPDWRDVWSLAKDIQREFKEVRYPTPDGRQKAWERFNALRDQASRQADQQKRKRLSNSAYLRDEILRRVAGTRPSSLFGFDPPDRNAMKDLGQLLFEAGKQLSNYKAEMVAEHKQECYSAIQDMRAIHDAWWADFKKQGSRRQEEWRERVRANLEKNYERHGKATDALERCQRHADKLRSDIASARGDDYAARASGWLAEEEARIDDIKASIAQIESWIAEGEAKLA